MGRSYKAEKRSEKPRAIKDATGRQATRQALKSALRTANSKGK